MLGGSCHLSFRLKIPVYLSMDVVFGQLPFTVWRSRTCCHAEWVNGFLNFLDCCCKPSIMVFLLHLENYPESLFWVSTLIALVSQDMRLWPTVQHRQRKREWLTMVILYLIILIITFNAFSCCLYSLIALLWTIPNSCTYSFILGCSLCFLHQFN